ncbi:MAG: (Fe-S)-binding protein, partial [Deltaproteobacteria bacterium]|nr:(Fe-S)-binding protein [Deltaproteobacteria bacterium]
METKYDFEREFGEQILSCSVCGFCQAVCPIYGLTRRPALNARGKMLVLQEVMKGDMELDEETVETLFQCTGCASCATNCPSGVKVPEILYRVRQEMVAKGTCHPVFSGMNDLLATEANIYAEKDPPEYQEGRKLNESAPTGKRKPRRRPWTCLTNSMWITPSSTRSAAPASWRTWVTMFTRPRPTRSSIGSGQRAPRPCLPGAPTATVFSRTSPSTRAWLNRAST